MYEYMSDANRISVIHAHAHVHVGDRTRWKRSRPRLLHVKAGMCRHVCVTKQDKKMPRTFLISYELDGSRLCIAVSDPSFRLSGAAESVPAIIDVRGDARGGGR